MAPIDFGVTRSKVKVSGHMCHSTFLVFSFIMINIVVELLNFEASRLEYIFWEQCSLILLHYQGSLMS